MEEAGKILPRFLRKQWGSDDNRLAALLGPLWPLIVGKIIAQHVKPSAFRAGMLTLATACPSWATELPHLGGEVRTRVNAFLGAAMVKRLHVRLVPQLEMEALAARRPPSRDTSGPNGPHEAPEAALSAALPDTAALHEELARIVQQSFIKYFSRPPNGMNGWR